MMRKFLKGILVVVIAFLAMILYLDKGMAATTSSDFKATEVKKFESGDDVNYIKVSILNGNSIKVKFHSEITAYEYRVSLYNGKGKAIAPVYVKPKKDKTGNGFEVKLTKKMLKDVKSGYYYVQITRARTKSQADKTNYGDKGTSYRDTVIKIKSDKTVRILDFKKVQVRNASFTLYDNPNDYLDTKLLDLPISLYNEKGELKNLTSSQLKYIKTVTKRVTKGCKTNYCKAKKVYEYVASHTYYDEYSHESGKRAGMADNPYINIKKIEENGKTATWCIGYSSMVVAMLRSVDVPTRIVYGYHMSTADGNWLTIDATKFEIDKHYWNEFYDGSKWLAMDTDIATSNTYERKSAKDKGKWVGGNKGKAALNNYTYFAPSAQQYAVDHYVNGIYSKALVTNSTDVTKLYKFFNQKDANGVKNSKKLGLTKSSYVSKTRIYSWNLDNIYSDRYSGYIQGLIMSGTASKDGGLVGEGDFSNLIKLKFFKALYNKNLKSLNFNGDKALESVYASYTGVTTITATGCSSLKTLVAAVNKLTSAKYTFNTNKNATITANEGGTFYFQYKDGKHTMKAAANDGYYFAGWYDAKGNKLADTYEYSTSTTASFTRIAKFKKLSAPQNVKVTATSSGSQMISWDKVEDADGYYIYKSDSKNGTYLKVKLEGGNTTSTEKNSLTTGKTFYYYVVAYKVVDGKTFYSPESAIVSKMVIPVAPEVNLTTDGSSVTISFAKLDKVNGYEIVRSTNDSTDFEVINEIGSNTEDVISYTDSLVTLAETYFYKVRSYRLVDGEKIYSDYSEAISIEVK